MFEWPHGSSPYGHIHLCHSLRMNVNMFTVFATANKVQWISWYEYPHMHKAVGKLQENCCKCLRNSDSVKPSSNEPPSTNPPTVGAQGSFFGRRLHEGRPTGVWGRERKPSFVTLWLSNKALLVLFQGSLVLTPPTKSAQLCFSPRGHLSEAVFIFGHSVTCSLHFQGILGFPQQ